MSDHIDTIPMMKWQAEQKGYTCNDCYLAMQNCHDRSICCEDETGLCDFFEEMPREDTISRKDAIDAALTFLVEYYGAAFDEDMQKMLCERIDALPSAEPKKGKWIPDKTGNSYWICTKCGFPSEASGAFALYHYCPNCGAYMRTDG